jgi:hypothetical protein
MTQDGTLQTGIVHWSWVAQPVERQATLENWTLTSQHSSQISYWTQDLLRSDGNQGGRTYHFACGVGRVNEVNDQILAVEECTDQTDTLQMRAIVTLHFAALENSV